VGLRAAVVQGVLSVRANPLRSALGALAIAAAVATIVVAVTALDGVRRYVEATTARTFGSDTFLLAQVASPGRVSRRELREQLQRNPAITRREVSFLSRYSAGQAVYAPNAQTRAGVSRASLRLDDVAVTGTSATLAQIRELGIVDGRFFTADEDRAGAAVAVIGADVAETLFPTGSPVGEDIRIAGRQFRVIGRQARIGNAGSGSLDKYAWVPLRAFERAFGAPRTIQVFARGTTGDTTAAEDHARVSLRASRSLGPGARDNFDVLAPEAARGFVASLAQRVGAAAAPISLMALLAAVVVVTNTVLVSVSQRTREIGVRRAIGARRNDILREIVAEAMVLALGGGVAGVLLAMGALAGIGALLPVPLTVAPQTILTGLVAAAGSGVAAGWLPAVRATRLDVIAALRSDG
jgi:putative ABC transport system permease protein